MKEAYLSIGSNQGDREVNLRQCTNRLALLSVKPLLASAVYESASWGYSGGDFLNQVVRCSTDLEPFALLSAIEQIERELGKVPHDELGYADRPIDIDILMLGDEEWSTEQLTVPHAHCHERSFVLMPWAEIAAHTIVPVYGMRVEQLLASCSDTTPCKRIAHV